MVHWDSSPIVTLQGRWTNLCNHGECNQLLGWKSKYAHFHRGWVLKHVKTQGSKKRVGEFPNRWTGVVMAGLGVRTCDPSPSNHRSEAIPWGFSLCVQRGWIPPNHPDFLGMGGPTSEVDMKRFGSRRINVAWIPCSCMVISDYIKELMSQPKALLSLIQFLLVRIAK